MRTLDLIQKKRRGDELSEDEIRFLIDHYSAEEIPDYQMSAFAMAVYFQGMTEAETLHLTRAMAESGETVEFPNIDGFIGDKHSTGGVGDKISLVLLPLVAAAGLAMGKLSGRGLGHTGGTIDKLESIPGFRADMSIDRFQALVREHRLVIADSSADLAPADHKLYALRDVTATVESIPMIVGSILSKKLAIGSQGMVFDVKTGAGAILPEYERMKEIAELLVKTGQGAGRQAAALVTDMSQPLGNTIGNALELREAVETLQGNGPSDVEALSLALGAELLVMAGEANDPEDGIARLRRHIDDGSAYEQFLAMVRAQDGDESVIDDVSELPQAVEQVTVEAPRNGVVQALNARAVGEVANLLGAGRIAKGESIDHAVGVVLNAKIGDAVSAGDPLAHLHVNGRPSLSDATDRLLAGFEIGDERVEAPALIHERIA
ncbi:MAG: thymidine phosphorylase [Candidatus Bipolaricaulia bacterium]